MFTYVIPNRDQNEHSELRPVLTESSTCYTARRKRKKVLKVQSSFVFHLKYPEVTTSFSLSLEVVLDGLAADPAAAASEAFSEVSEDFSSSEFHTLPGLHQRHDNTTLEQFEDRDPGNHFNQIK